MSLWSRSSTRTYLLEGNGFVTSNGKVAKVPGPNSYNQPASPRIRGTTTYAPIHGKTDREKILSNGVRVNTMSPLGPGTYNPKRVAGPGSPRSNPATTSPDKKPKPFGSGTKRGDLHVDKNTPGPGEYNLSLPSLSNRGKFIDTSARKCCSPSQKELPPELSPTQQQWLSRVQNSSSNNDCGLSDSLGGGSSPLGPPRCSATRNTPRNKEVSPSNTSGVLDMNMRGLGPSPPGAGRTGNSPHPPPGARGVSPALSDSMGNISPRGPKIKGGTISPVPRPMNLHNLNSALARDRDMDYHTPAPGTYDGSHKKSTDRQLGGRISQSPRNCSLINTKECGNVPGPGSYESNSKDSMTASFGPSGIP